MGGRSAAIGSAGPDAREDAAHGYCPDSTARLLPPRSDRVSPLRIACSAAKAMPSRVRTRESCWCGLIMEPSPVPPTAPAQVPVRASRATLVNIVGWPAAALLVASYLVLIGRLTSFPFEDFPDHVARAKVLTDLLFHHGAQWGGVFAFHLRLVPYLLHDIILTSLVAALGTTAGGVVFNALGVLSLPCALLYYMHVNRLSFQGRPLVILVSLYLATDWFFLVGFAAFRLALALLIVCIALADALRERWSTRLYGVYLAVLLAGYLEHLTVLVFLAVTLAVSATARLAFRRSTARREIRLALPVIVLLALYFGLLAGPHHASSPEIYALYWGSVRTKINGLQDELLRYGGRASRPMMLLLAFCLLWPVRRELISRRLLAPAVIEPIALAVAFLGVYFALPGTYPGAAYVDVRALPMIVLFILMAVLHLDARARGYSRNAASEFAGAPALAAAVVLAAVNLAYVGWHLEKDNAWMQAYRAVVARIPRGATVLPIYTQPHTSFGRLEHAGAFVLLDRDGLTPYIFAGNLGDPMSYFDFIKYPYAPVEQWYRFQEIWNRSPVFTLRAQGQSYRWRFRYDVDEHDWQPAVLAPVSWGEVACIYPYILVNKPYDPSYIEVTTRLVADNSSAALLAVDRTACRPGSAATLDVTLPPPQVTY
jgi:hypothetical protein